MKEPENTDIVISGISGRYPESSDIDEFWAKLVSGEELTSSDDRRWPVELSNLPKRSGKLKDIDRFDADFFKVEDYDANLMDPQIRLLHEVTYESIWDAGIDPATLKGSRTGVFIGLCYNDTNTALREDECAELSFRQCESTRISHAFDFTGPALQVDTACASSFSALHEGVLSLKAKMCDNLIIAGVACHLRPAIAGAFRHLRMLSADGRSKCLDESVDGYCRSEAVVALFIQKRQFAKRIYATLLSCETNCDGFKSEGITFPASKTQTALMKRTIGKTGINPEEINYIEAHVTGTMAGDPVECNSILNAYRENSTKKLLFGCLKSNIGHSEGASANCGLTKIALAFQRRCLPPNLHFKKPNPNIEGLKTGIIEPVTTKRPFHENVVAINTFGFGGVNHHAILQANERVVSEKSYKIVDKLSRLINFCNRTQDGLEFTLHWLMKNTKQLTVEFLALLNNVSNVSYDDGMKWRGFFILNQDLNVVSQKTTCLSSRKPLWIVPSLTNCQWYKGCNKMKALEPFWTSLTACTEFLKSLDFDLNKAITGDDSLDESDKILTSLAANIAFIDFLSSLNIKPDGMLGGSVESIVVAYAGKWLTREEALVIATQFMKQSPKKAYINGNSKHLTLSNILDVCLNGKRNGITRDEQCLSSYIENAKNKINKSHNSKEMTTGGMQVTTSVDKIPEDACVVDLKNLTVKLEKSVTQAATAETLEKDVLAMLGTLYLAGFSPKIETLYPAVSYPVPRETLSLAPLIKWDHSKSWFLTKFPNYFDVFGKVLRVDVDLIDPDFKYLSGHCIDGRNLFPATGYLHLVVQHLIKVYCIEDTSKITVEFKDVKFSRATLIPKMGTVSLYTRFLERTGDFSVTESGALCAKGKVFWEYSGSVSKEPILSIPKEDEAIFLNTSEIYREFRVRGYDYGPTFQGLLEANAEGTHGKVKWTDYWVSFTDSMLQLAILSQKARTLNVPVFLEYLKCDFHALHNSINAAKAESSDVVLDIVFNKVTGIGSAKGFMVKGLETATLARRKTLSPKVDTLSFVSYTQSIELSKETLDSLKQYTNYCEQVLHLLSKKSEGAVLNGLKGEVEKFMESSPFTCKLLETLIKVVEADNSKTTLKSSLMENKFQLDEDDILSLSLYDLIPYTIDTTMDNVLGKTVDIAEVNCTGKYVCNELRGYLSERSIYPDYTLFSKESAPKVSGCDALVMLQEEPNFGVNKNDLVIFKDSATGFASMNNLDQETDFDTILQSSYKSLKDKGFLLIITRTDLTVLERMVMTATGIEYPTFSSLNDIQNKAIKSGFTLISTRTSNDSTSVLLFRKLEASPMEPVFIHVDPMSYEWVEKVKELISTKSETNIWLLSKNLKTSGIIGLVKCLRKEPGAERIRCALTSDSKMDLEEVVRQQCTQTDLVYNVFKNGQFGCYCHKEIVKEKEPVTSAEHSYLSIRTKGDLSSFEWIEAPHKYWLQIPDKYKDNRLTLCNVYYAALNFKDVMLASGRIPFKAYPTTANSGKLGMEYAGVDENGNRIFGFCDGAAIASSLIIDKNSFFLPVPNTWTLEEASTVSVVYTTVYYALLIRGRLRKGETVLIHAGSGGVGQAAISVCLSMGCKIFTTVGSKEKQEFLKARFPQLNDDNFCNSRDLSFEENLMKKTGGRGVDIVLNSLAESKFHASCRCLAHFGRFIEIGKYDIVQNHTLNNAFTDEGNRTFEAICVAHLFHDMIVNRSPQAIKICQQIKYFFREGMKNGEIIPLPRSVFDIHSVEDAFRHMAAGKHIGKVVIKLRDEENKSSLGNNVTLPSLCRTYFHPLKSYIVIGGLGGLGLEIVQWLATRGAKNIVITSRSGVKTSYQRLVMKRLLASGVKTHVAVNDATTYESVKQLLTEANNMRPVGGVFNLAMVLSDALFENQTPENFSKVCMPKVHTTIFLDQATRSLCPKMEYFVCFSSAASGRGNAGQTNYAFANSVMESICESRRDEGLHGLAIQWGAVGDVGFVAEKLGNDAVVLGTLPQRIPSCLEVLDSFMQSPFAVASSIILVNNAKGGGGQREDLIKTICHVLGVKDYASLDPSTTLGDLGMDSLMAVEIRQGLERDYDVVVTTQELRAMKISDLKEISSKKSKEKQADGTENQNGSDVDTNKISLSLPTELFVTLNKGVQGQPIFLLPPIEGTFEALMPIINYIARPVIGVNWVTEVDNFTTVEEVANFYAIKLREHYSDAEYDIIGYSFGALIATAICYELEKLSTSRIIRNLILLDGAPDALKAHTSAAFEVVTKTNDSLVDKVTNFLSSLCPSLDTENLKETLSKSSSEEELKQKAAEILSAKSGEKQAPTTVVTAADRYQRKLQMIHTYTPEGKISGTITLFRPKENLTKSAELPLDEDYGLSKLAMNKPEIQRLPGDHKTFISTNARHIGNHIEANLHYIAA